MIGRPVSTAYLVWGPLLLSLFLWLSGIGFMRIVSFVAGDPPPPEPPTDTVQPGDSEKPGIAKNPPRSIERSSP